MSLARLVVLFALLGLGLAGTAEAAAPHASAAMTRYGVRGKPGRTVMYKVKGWAGDTYGAFPSMRLPGPVVYRTKGTRRRRRVARRRQKICVSLELWKFKASYADEGLNSWRLEGYRRSCGYASRGEVLTFRNWDVSVVPYFSYSVNLVVSWRRRGRLLGRAVYDYDDSAQDYSCQTNRCVAYQAYRDTGALFFDF